MRTIEGIKEAISENRKKQNQKVAEIRADTHYSDKGKADLLASANAEAMTTHRQLQKELSDLIEETRSRLEHAAFTAPIGKEDAYRNAVQQASILTDGKARDKAIALATKTGDSLTLRAHAAVAHGGDEWSTVAQIAQSDKSIAALVEFEQEHGKLRSAKQKFGQAVAMTAPEKPKEVAFAHTASTSDK